MEYWSSGLKENLTNNGIRDIACVFFNAGIRVSEYEGVVIGVSEKIIAK
jgi:hypothetical protein